MTGDPVAARDAAAKVLESLKFRIQWENEWTAIAERGSKVVNVVAGALAQYFKVGLRVFAADPGQSVVRFERLSRGFMGGAIGAVRTRRNMERLRDRVRDVFQEEGILVGVDERR